MEIKTITELKEHLGEPLYACSLCPLELDKPTIVRHGMLFQPIGYWTCDIKVINKVEDIRNDTFLMLVNPTTKEIVKCYGWYGKWYKSSNKPYYDKTKIFTTEKELDIYIEEYNRKNIKKLIKSTKSKIWQAKRTLKDNEKKLVELQKFAEEKHLL